MKTNHCAQTSAIAVTGKCVFKQLELTSARFYLTLTFISWRVVQYCHSNLYCDITLNLEVKIAIYFSKSRNGTPFNWFFLFLCLFFISQSRRPIHQHRASKPNHPSRGTSHFLLPDPWWPGALDLLEKARRPRWSHRYTRALRPKWRQSVLCWRSWYVWGKLRMHRYQSTGTSLNQSSGSDICT